MPARKRTHDEFERDEAPPPPSLLTRIRNDWRFANILQYIQIFGAAVKIDEDIDVDVRLHSHTFMGHWALRWHWNEQRLTDLEFR